MPSYPLRCPKCGHEQDTYAKMAERYAIRCDECGVAPMETRFESMRLGVPLDYTAQRDGGESLVDGYHPSEVAEARRLFPSKDIRDDGTVRYHSAEHRRRCHAEEARALSREREKNQAARERDPQQVVVSP